MTIPDSVLYDIFSILIICFGLWGGTYFIFKGVKIKHNPFISFLTITLGIAYAFIGVIYLLSLMGMEINLGVYVRPVLTLTLLFPILIVHEVQI